MARHIFDSAFGQENSPQESHGYDVSGFPHHIRENVGAVPSPEVNWTHGSFERQIQEASWLLGVRGRVLRQESTTDFTVPNFDRVEYSAHSSTAEHVVLDEVEGPDTDTTFSNEGFTPPGVAPDAHETSHEELR